MPVARFTLHYKTRIKTQSYISFLLSLSQNSYVFKDKLAKKAVQDCLDLISALKKRPTKKAVPADKPSPDDDPQDRISPASMSLKKRPAKTCCKKIVNQFLKTQIAGQPSRLAVSVSIYREY